MKKFSDILHKVSPSTTVYSSGTLWFSLMDSLIVTAFEAKFVLINIPIKNAIFLISLIKSLFNFISYNIILYIINIILKVFFNFFLYFIFTFIN